MRVVETLQESVSQTQGDGRADVLLRELEPRLAKGVLDVLNDVLLDRFYVVTHVLTHNLPHFLVQFFFVQLQPTCRTKGMLVVVLGFLYVELGSQNQRLVPQHLRRPSSS